MDFPQEIMADVIHAMVIPMANVVTLAVARNMTCKYHNYKCMKPEYFGSFYFV